MTPDERQALREKHSQDEKNQCSYCLYERYPCDVIKVLDEVDQANFQAAINYERGYDNGYKVLDATENLKFNDLKTKVECEHLWLSRANAKYQWTVFTYCPKCGEKL